MPTDSSSSGWSIWTSSFSTFGSVKFCQWATAKEIPTLSLTWNKILLIGFSLILYTCFMASVFLYSHTSLQPSLNKFPQRVHPRRCPDVINSCHSCHLLSAKQGLKTLSGRIMRGQTPSPGHPNKKQKWIWYSCTMLQFLSAFCSFSSLSLCTCTH